VVALEEGCVIEIKRCQMEDKAVTRKERIRMTHWVSFGFHSTNACFGSVLVLNNSSEIHRAVDVLTLSERERRIDKRERERRRFRGRAHPTTHSVLLWTFCQRNFMSTFQKVPNYEEEESEQPSESVEEKSKEVSLAFGTSYISAPSLTHWRNISHQRHVDFDNHTDDESYQEVRNDHTISVLEGW